MAFDRRTMLASMLLTSLLPGCAKAAPPSPPTPWAMVSVRFLGPEGRIIDTGNGNISHSEGQGYGMLLAEAAGDRQGFDKLWAWTEKTLARKDVRLFSWKYDPAANPPVSDPNNASDGDILIAWALLRAGARWKEPSYTQASAQIRAAIRQRLIWNVGGRTILLPGLDGFVTPKATTLNLSYYVWPALDTFRKADGVSAWGPLIGDGEKLTAAARFGPYRLPPDWIDIDDKGKPSPSQGRPPRFGFDAIRVPLYLAWSGRSSLVQPFRAFWQRYAKLGQKPPAWIDVVNNEVAPYPLSDGAVTIVQRSDNQKTTIANLDKENYYSAILASLSIISSSSR